MLCFINMEFTQELGKSKVPGNHFSVISEHPNDWFLWLLLAFYTYHLVIIGEHGGSVHVTIRESSQDSQVHFNSSNTSYYKP